MPEKGYTPPRPAAFCYSTKIIPKKTIPSTHGHPGIISNGIIIYIHTYIHTYITLHYITLHYITLHYITLHYITLHYITLHYITLHYITLHYITYIHTYMIAQYVPKSLHI